MTTIFRCGTAGCAALVTGIYCDACRAVRPVEVTPATARISPGERVRLMYRGVTKDGVIEKVGRTNVVVVITVGKGSRTKEKLVRIPASELLRETA